tara:strand:- start:2385 stop:3350 length:966 start_codon:yes stop_codon:yes gene_type:complete
MKITFNTSQPNAPCSMFYSEALHGMEGLTFYDGKLSLYDVGLFMTYDHAMIKAVRQKFPNLKIGIIDPRNYEVYESTQYCDFLVIDSVEMEDYWRKSRKPLFNYVEYPNIPSIKKQHEEKDKVIIGYHGNQIHLECMAQNVTPALSELGEKYNLELLVMHNGSAPSGRESWYPKNVSVRHIPWSMENYTRELSKSDIGIVPNNMIHDTTTKHLTSTNSSFNYNRDDYSLRFKMPSNPGRFVIFGKMGIPVVADFYPSALQLLQDGTGFVAHSPDGWRHCLEQLISSRELRQNMGDSLQNLVETRYNFTTQNKRFLQFLGTL